MHARLHTYKTVKRGKKKRGEVTAEEGCQEVMQGGSNDGCIYVFIYLQCIYMFT